MKQCTSANCAALFIFQASLAVHKTEVIGLQKALRNSSYENKQLHSNIQDLNRRAYMMAQEVDERHATLETSARAEVSVGQNKKRTGFLH